MGLYPYKPEQCTNIVVFTILYDLFSWNHNYFWSGYLVLSSVSDARLDYLQVQFSVCARSGQSAIL